MDELAGAEIAEEEVELAEGGFSRGVELGVPGEKVIGGGSFEEDSEGVFVEVAELLVEIESGGRG